MLKNVESSDKKTKFCSEQDEGPSRKKHRRNIRRVKTDLDLKKQTREAQEYEIDRKKRAAEKEILVTETPISRWQKMVLDTDPETKDEIISVDEGLLMALKQHQKEGVKFMFDSCFESADKINESIGGGCILAHCMGLGKTVQVITLVHALITHDIWTHVKNVLIVSPVNTISNWVEEFERWLPESTQNQDISIYNIANTQIQRRAKEVKKWSKQGGVLVIGYNMFRDLTYTKDKIPKELRSIFKTALIHPGPDLTVFDEGHILKNSHSSSYKAVDRIRCKRRIILSGTPLQNNLNEFYNIMKLVKPDLLGTYDEFSNMFVNPIANGQFIDSTADDIALMKSRSHMLHELVGGCIQRKDHSVLAEYLPPKYEYVIYTRLTKLQVDLYKYYIRKMAHLPRKSGKMQSKVLFEDFEQLKKIWTHARLLIDSDLQSIDPKPVESIKKKKWWESRCSPEELEDISHSSKLMLLFSILDECEKLDDKMLVFSQNLSTLNLIEHFLKNTRSWKNGKEYLRLDGSMNSNERSTLCHTFTSDEKVKLFLISTRAGGMGINLTAANRVILFDVSWNPSNDSQSIYRIYRLGQTKPCYIYRFVTYGTMESKIYERQVTKVATFMRVVDELQVDRHYKQSDLTELYSVANLEAKYEHTSPHEVPQDEVLAMQLKKYPDRIQKYHLHDSLLENTIETSSTDKETKTAIVEFDGEKSQPIDTQINQGAQSDTPITSNDTNFNNENNEASAQSQLTGHQERNQNPTLFGIPSIELLRLLKVKAHRDHPDADNKHDIMQFFLKQLHTQAKKNDKTLLNELLELMPLIQKQNQPNPQRADQGALGKWRRYFTDKM